MVTRLSELEIATIALEMIAYPIQQGASREQSGNPEHLKEIARVALAQMIDAKYGPPERTLLSEICL
jgi:hypothetical protein